MVIVLYSGTYGMVTAFADRINGNGIHVRGDISLFLFQYRITNTRRSLIMKIEFFCKYCRKSLHVAYETTGDKNTKVLQGIIMTCGRCHNKHPRAMSLHNVTEGELLEKAVAGKIYI